MSTEHHWWLAVYMHAHVGHDNSRVLMVAQHDLVVEIQMKHHGKAL
jgi:exoribonuclease R